MNSARSTALGWAALIAAAGVSFFYAKKGIDARRKEQGMSGERPPEIKDWRQRIEQPAPQQLQNKDQPDSYTKSSSPDNRYKAGNPTKD